MRGLSIVIVLIAALVAYGAYLRPTESQLTYVRTRLSVAQGELATVLGRTVIEPRLRREHEEIKRRLSGLAPQSPSQSESEFVVEATALAQRTGTHITQIISKGAMVPLAMPTAAATRAPAPVPSGAVQPVAIRAVDANLAAAVPSSSVQGVRLPRTLTVDGSFPNLLRFVDGLGALHTLARVNLAGLAQTDKLRATIDLDLIVVDAVQVREALL